jgi:hypothetical protein
MLLKVAASQLPSRVAEPAVPPPLSDLSSAWPFRFCQKPMPAQDRRQ